MLTDAELRVIRRDTEMNLAAASRFADAETDRTMLRLLDEIERLRQALARIEALDQTVHGLVIGNIAREALGASYPVQLK